MRADRGRKKKLIVAFHFQFTNQAGWNCESCRRYGLEAKRRCGFLAEAQRGEAQIVWGRKRAQTEECPKSFVTGESLAWIEEFFVRRRLETEDLIELDARTVDAFLILRDEMEREQRDGTTQY